MNYRPIENYGIIGDLSTVALVGLDGSIDFMCLPEFDSPSIFAALLDSNKGGYFKISPENGDVKNKQMYLPYTNVLLTRFLSPDGVGEATDFMPVEELFEGKELIRRIACIHGDLSFKMECRPRFDYARVSHTTEFRNEREIIFTSTGTDKSVIRLRSDVPMKSEGSDAVAEFHLTTGQKATFMLEYLSDSSPEVSDIEEFSSRALFDTINYWKSWISKCLYRGRWTEVVNRSALVLKLKIGRASCRGRGEE